MFVDRAEIHIESGKGGNGCVSFRREPFVPEGGPDGGDGGKGGDVVLCATNDLRTLMDFRYKKKYKAENGQDGMRKKRFGKKGQDLVIKVPTGTVVLEKESGLIMCDLKEDGQSFVCAKGGKGGKGNTRYKNSVRQAPNFAEAGTDANARDIILELKMIADVGLVGFPNVGKSSLLAVATSAKPKIENYHFTTIEPNLGVVEIGDESFVMADIAGIIEGAHKGLGLGLKFLKHIERTRVLIHIVDVSGSEGRDPIDDFNKIMDELKWYSPKILEKPMIVAANKVDLIDENGEDYTSFKEYVESGGYKVFPLSAPIDHGVSDLMKQALYEIKNAPEPEQIAEGYFDFESDDLDPTYRDVDVYLVDGVYVVEGKQLKKIFDSTNFNDFGSLRYLYRYIEKQGAIDRMKELGLEEGNTVRVFDYEFEYYDEY